MWGRGEGSGHERAFIGVVDEDKSLMILEAINFISKHCYFFFFFFFFSYFPLYKTINLVVCCCFFVYLAFHIILFTSHCFNEVLSFF